MTATHIAIRTATAADNVLLAELGARTFFDSYADQNTPENMAAYLAASFSPQLQAQQLAIPSTLFLIAEIEQTAAGYAQLQLNTPPPVPNYGTRRIELKRLYSDLAWIGRGIGAALMTASLELAEQKSCDAIWLDVWERNPRAIAFYRKWGFDVIATATFQVGSDLQHDFLMGRMLTAGQPQQQPGE